MSEQRFNLEDVTYDSCVHLLGGKVIGKVYYAINKSIVKITVLEKTFTPLWRSPMESDYKKASDWCKRQLLSLKKANENTI